MTSGVYITNFQVKSRDLLDQEKVQKLEPTRIVNTVEMLWDFRAGRLWR